MSALNADANAEGMKIWSVAGPAGMCKQKEILNCLFWFYTDKSRKIWLQNLPVDNVHMEEIIFVHIHK